MPRSFPTGEITMSNHSKNVTRRRRRLGLERRSFLLLSLSLFYLYDDLIEALRHFARAYTDRPAAVADRGDFPLKNDRSAFNDHFWGRNRRRKPRGHACLFARSSPACLTARGQNVVARRSITQRASAARLKCPPSFPSAEEGKVRQ